MKKAMKKMLAIALAMLLLAGTMTAMMVSATETETEPTAFTSVELFEGGDVESATAQAWGGKWSGKPTETETFVTSIETTTVKSGSKAIKMVSTNADTAQYGNIYGTFAQSSQDNSITEVRGWINVEDLSKDSKVVVNCYNGSTSSSRDMKVEHEFTAETNGWKQFYAVIDAINSYTTKVLDIRIYGSGTVYIDDVSVKDTESLLPTDFGKNWLSKAALGTADNYYITETQNYTGSRSLYFGAVDSGTKTPRIYTSFTSRNRPVDGTKYRFSFWFKPADPENESAGPTRIYIGPYNTAASDIYNYPYVTMQNDNLVKGKQDKGWREYNAYFTLPTTDANKNVAIMLYGLGANNNGYYDNFRLVPDYEEDIMVVNATGQGVKTASVGDTIYMKKHVIADKTQDEGGRELTMILALYATVDGKKVLRDVKFADKTVYDGVDKLNTKEEKLSTQGAEDVMSEGYTIPSDAAGCTIKAFSWDGASTLTALDGGFTVSVNE